MSILRLHVDAHFFMRLSMSNLSAMSLLSAMHIISLSFSGVRDDLHFVHMRFMAENALSTLAVDVDKAFF